MKKLATIILLCAFLTACAGKPAANASRQATFSFVLNDVQTRADAGADLQPAAPGDQLQVGGQAQSGETGRASLDLEPEDTVVRIGPNTLFTLEALETEDGAPLSRLQLLFGQLWIVLAGGSLEVETPYGLAAVRGSYMSVAFDKAQGMVVTCLEGHCSLANEAGTVELTDGQTSSIPQAEEPPSPPQQMEDEDYIEWKQVSPEAVELLNPDEEDEPRYTEDGQLIPQEAEGSLITAPLTFELSNNCPADSPVGGDWLWQFERLPDENGEGFVETFVIPNGQTFSGTLPPGQYVVTDWFSDGQQHGPQLLLSDKTFLHVRSCPEGDGQPVNPPPASPPR